MMMEQFETEQSETEHQKMHSDRVILTLSLSLLVMEIWKELYLYFIYFGGHFNVWYVSFQLCSTPMYLGLLISWFSVHPGKYGVRFCRAAATFLQDYALLGGAAALIVHDGFTYPKHPLLTAHGYLWHIILIVLSVYCFRKGYSDRTPRGFRRTLPIFSACCVIAEFLNILLHPFGDCDMFYISPYHVSSQIVFCDIDRVVGRPAGIVLYLLNIVFAAWVIHMGYYVLSERRRRA